MTKLYQPHYDNGEIYEDADHWSSLTVYYTEEEAVAEIKSKGYLDLGDTSWDGVKTYTFDNTDKEYGQEKLGYAFVDVLTLGGAVNDK